MDDASLNQAALCRVPTLPQETTVLFPGTVLPLHVTDAETSSLVAEVTATDRLVVVVKVAAVTEASTNRPRLCEFGCLGSIIHAEKLPSGSYNVLIQGLQRVRLIQEITGEQIYRRFRVEIIPGASDVDLLRASKQLGRLESCIMSLLSAFSGSDEQLCEVLRSTPDPVQLADVLAAAAISNSELQQRLLATTDLEERLRALIDGLADVMVRIGVPPKAAQRN